MTTDEQPDATAVAVIVGPETPELAEFRDRVAADGVTWAAASDAPGSPAVMLITDAAAPAPDPAVLDGREILPVSLLDGFSPLFPELSHLSPRRLGVDIAARRLAEAVRFGSSTLLAWERLADEARDWRVTGADEHLLAESAQPAALSLLAAPRARAAGDQADLVREFVMSSVAHTRRRRRRGTVILGLVAAVLVGALVVASVQAIAAKTASDRSIAAANAADARRLSDVALNYVGQDPDLPQLLASTAAALADTPEVRSAVGDVAASAVPHRTIALDGVPDDVQSSASGRLAVSLFNDSLVRIFESDGTPVGTVDVAPRADEPPATAMALDPSGTRLAVANGDTGALQLFDVASGDPVDVDGWDADHDTLLAWWDDGHLLIGGPGSVDLLAVSTGERTVLAGGDLGDVVAAKPSFDRAYLALSDAQVVEVWDLAAGEEVHRAEVPGVYDLGVSEDGVNVVGAAFPHAKLLAWGSDGESVVTADDGDWATIGVEALPGGYLAASDRVGNLAIFAPAALTSDAIARFPAHLDDIARLAVLPGGNIATVGYDKYLRIWDTSTLADLGTAAAATLATRSASSLVIFDQEGGLDSYPPATMRNEIRARDDGAVEVVLTYLATTIRTDPAAPDDVADGMRTGVFNHLFLTRDGRYLVSAHGSDDRGIEVRPYTDSVFEADTVFIDADLPTGPSGGFLGALLPEVSSDGGSIALATPTELSVWDRAGTAVSSDPYAVPSSPLAVTVGDDGVARAVTADGVLHTSGGGDDVDLLALWPDATDHDALSAAEFAGDDLLLLVDSGAILRVHDGVPRVIAPRGTTSGTGTLRVSDDGALIAHVGPDAVTVLRTLDGAVLARRTTIVGIPLEDVAFSADAAQLFAVSRIGTITTIDLAGEGIAPLVTAPRTFTPAESLGFDLGDHNG